jgi:hypothetical protein
VTNVIDSRTTIRQGRNIRVLTLITIAYLPLGYVTVSPRPSNLALDVLGLKRMYQGLFSVNHGILPANANSQLYAGLVVIFMVWTYGLALGLDEILAFLEPRWKTLKGRIFLDHPRPTSGPDASGGSADMSKASIGRATGYRKWTGRRRAGHDAETQWEPA